MHNGRGERLFTRQSRKDQETQSSNLLRVFTRHRTRIQPAKVRRGFRQQRVRLARLDDAARIQDYNAVVIKDGVELVGDGEDGVAAEFLADDSLHDFICFGVDAVFFRE